MGQTDAMTAEKKPGWRDFPRNWYVVVTNPNNEKKAVGELRRAGFRVFLPSQAIQQRNRKTGERKVRFRPLLTGYLFLKFPENKHDRHGVPEFGVVRKCQGVKAFVTSANERGEFSPFSIEDKDVAAFLRRQRQREFGIPTTEDPKDRRARMYWPGRKMTVSQGPFASFIATIEQVLGNGDVEAIVTIFGRETRLRVENPDDILTGLAPSREAA